MVVLGVFPRERHLKRDEEEHDLRHTLVRWNAGGRSDVAVPCVAPNVMLRQDDIERVYDKQQVINEVAGHMQAQCYVLGGLSRCCYRD